MAFSGGTYTRTNGTNSGANLWVADRDAGTKITAVNHDLHDEDIATALSSCLLKDGTQTVTANIPMATYKFTGLGAGSAATDSANLGQVQAGAFGNTLADTGAENAYVITPAPAITAFAAGQRFSFIAANASTGASTVNVSGLGTKAIEYQSVALTGAEIKATSTIVIEYDGTAFQMVSPSNLLSTATGDVLASNNGSEFTEATFKTNLNMEAGVDYAAYDADALFADVDDTLTAGFGGTDDADGTKSSGTYTPTYSGGNYKTITHGAGAFAIAPQSGTGQLLIAMVNASASGAVTTSGYDTVTGDTIDQTGTNKFLLVSTVVGTFSHLHVIASDNNA